MSDGAQPDLLAQLETAWKIINLQADTALKLEQGKVVSSGATLANLLADTVLKQAQRGSEFWKVAISGMTAGAALVAATVAAMKIFGG